MNVSNWQRRNRIVQMKIRMAHPWPIWKKTGGIEAVVIRANGDREDLGKVATTYAKRSMFDVSTGQ